MNRELIRLYWEIGKLIAKRQKSEGWGKSVVVRLAVGLQQEFPWLKTSKHPAKKFLFKTLKRYVQSPGYSSDTFQSTVRVKAFNLFLKPLKFLVGG